MEDARVVALTVAGMEVCDDIRQQIIDVALDADATSLSPRELAVRCTDEKRYFVSEATVYRLSKAQDI